MMNVGWCLMESRVICMFKDKIGVECMEEEEMGSVERKKELGWRVTLVFSWFIEFWTVLLSVYHLAFILMSE